MTISFSLWLCPLVESEMLSFGRFIFILYVKAVMVIPFPCVMSLRCGRFRSTNNIHRHFHISIRCLEYKIVWRLLENSLRCIVSWLVNRRMFNVFSGCYMLAQNCYPLFTVSKQARSMRWLVATASAACTIVCEHSPTRWRIINFSTYERTHRCLPIKTINP